MKAIRFYFSLATLLVLISVGAVTEATAKPARSRRTPSAPLTPYQLKGVVQDVTDSRIFIKTSAGVEHAIRIDARTTILDEEGKAHPAPSAALLRPGELIEVELDRLDVVKSAVIVSPSPQLLVKK